MARKIKQAEEMITLESSDPDIGVGALPGDIAVAAYFRAESRGFVPGHELDDWLLAEQECAGRQMGG